MLALLIFLPLLFALLVPLAGKKQVRLVALLGMLAPLALGLFMASQVDWMTGGGSSSDMNIPWIPEYGLNFALGVDSVSGLLMLLTLILGPICVISSKTAITDRVRTYYGWLLALQTAMLGVFAARDLVLFYICFEFTLIPMFVLINLYGSTNRRAAAVKFFLYTFTGSVIALAGLIYVAWFNSTKINPGVWSFAFTDLMVAAQKMSFSEQSWVFLALMAGFAVKVPIFPLHTWLPLAHTEAPTAGSVILAGVLLKLGTYAIYTFVLPFVPAATIHYAPLMATLSIIGIVAVGLVCWVQRDVKKLVAYSSVAHLGFCMLGMFALNVTGLKGSILYMINHGLSTGAIFLCIGMMYERYHTRSMDEVGGLAKKMPVWACFMVFFAMASVGLPMLNGFVSEFMCLMATFQAGETWVRSGLVGQGFGGTIGVLGPTYAAIAGTGMIIAAIYTLYMVGKVVFGPLKVPGGDHGDHGHGHGHDHGHAKGDESHGHLPTDLNAREIGVLVPLAALCLFLGLYPRPVLDAIDRSTQATHQMVWTEGKAKMRQEAGGVTAMGQAPEQTTTDLTPSVAEAAIPSGAAR
jgi:NADH-quinone oxidoreductase subunit M